MERVKKMYYFEPHEVPEVARISVILQVFQEMENDRERKAAMNYIRERFLDGAL